MFVDDQRLYLHLQTDEHMKSYDLFTGKDPITYDQGFSLSEYEQSTWFRKGFWGRRLGRGEPARSLVADGKLVQVYMHRIYVLDAKTGKRLWMHEDTSRTFNRPLVQGGKLVMLAGPQEETFRRSGNYKNDLEGFFTDQIIAFDLTTGEPAWAVDNPLPEHYPSVRNLASQPGYVAAMFDYGTEVKSAPKPDGFDLSSNKIALINVDSGEVGTSHRYQLRHVPAPTARCFFPGPCVGGVCQLSHWL